MKYLITGSSGFLGQRFLLKLLEESDADIWCVDLVPHPKGLPHDVGDVVEWLQSFDEHVDIVYHFAAPVGGRIKIESDPLFNADSLRIDSALFRWAATHADKVVYPSSSAVYPRRFQSIMSNQSLFEMDVHPDSDLWGTPDEMYGFTKLAGEVLAWKAAQYGLHTLAIRPFSGYGPGQSFDYPVPSIARRALHREDPLTVWGTGRQTRDFVHVDDLVGATQARIRHGLNGYQAMNIASGVATSFLDLAYLCAEIVGYRPEIVALGASDKTPQGVFHRVGSDSVMKSHYELTIPLRQGLETVMEEIERAEGR